MNKKELVTATFDEKLDKTKQLIIDWYSQFDGDVYVAFSGGKDSTVLLDIVKRLYTDVPPVFVNGGLEFPEIVEFARTFTDLIELKPSLTFKQILDKHGFPIISKNVSMAINRYQRTKSETQKHLRLHGGINPTSGKVQRTGVIPKKWHYLKDEFKISEACCDVIKKTPFKRYERETGRVAMVGTMAAESNQRRIRFLQDECNMYSAKRPVSKPLSFWDEDDIWEYIKRFGLRYSDIYDKGYKRTGCMFCMYGLHMEEKGRDRFDLMKETHPTQFNYCMTKLGLSEVIKEYTGREYGLN